MQTFQAKQSKNMDSSKYKLLGFHSLRSAALRKMSVKSAFQGWMSSQTFEAISNAATSTGRQFWFESRTNAWRTSRST